MNFIFVRHGESTANKESVYGGHSMCELTELWEKQAKQTADILKDKDITAIVSSDLTRAFATAEIIASEIWFTEDIIKQDLFRELDAWELTWTPTQLRVSILGKAIESKTWEKIPQIKERAVKAIEFLQSIKTDGNVLVVGHNSFTSVLFSMIDGQSDLVSYRRTWNMKNGSIKEVAL